MLDVTDKEQGPAGIVDMLAHWYPEGCVREMIGDQPEFDLVASPGGGHRLTWRGSLVMSLPSPADVVAALSGNDAVSWQALLAP